MKVVIFFLFLVKVALMQGCTTDTTISTKQIDKVGVCAFTWTPLNILDTFKQVRVFVSTDFIYNQNGLFVEPIHRSRTSDGKGLDTWLRECKRRGILPTLCVNQSPTFYGHTNADHPPVRTGADRTKPESYKEFAQVFGQLARRYGRSMHHSNTLKVDTLPRWTNDPPNKRLSGLNLPLILEVWNEPDKWWHKGTPVYMEPKEYAAMLSACYDSIKAADPQILVCMAGLTNFDTTYLHGMDEWFTAQRGGKWPCDIINVHHYSNSGNRLGQHPPTWNMSGGVPPELDADFARINDVVFFARSKGKKIWVSEFGYDTRPPSWAHVVPINGQSDEVTQGQYLIKSYEAYFKAGVDACFMFTANNEQGAKNGGLYQNSGLLYGEGETGREYKEKESYHIITNWLGSLK